MGTIIGGLATGIDSQAMIDQLIQAGSKPITLLNSSKSKIQSQTDAYTAISSALSSLRTAAQSLSATDKISTFGATSSDATVATATAGTSAVAGAYTLSVTQLAQNQRQVSSEGYQSLTDTKFGIGDILVSDGTSAAPKKISITSGNNSLSGIISAINNSDANVTATVINDGSATPFRLVISGKDTKNYIVDMSGLVPAPGGAPGTGEVGTGAATPATATYANPTFAQSGATYVEGKDAIFTVNGVSQTRKTNTVDDAIPGVTLNLLKGGNSSTNITISADTAATSQKIQGFVSSYNSAISLINQYTKYNSAGKTAGVLQGNSVVGVLKSQLQKLVATPVKGANPAYSLMSQVGIKTNSADGTLVVDSAALNAALGANYGAVVSLFSAKPAGAKLESYGIANKFDETISSLVSAYGTGTGTGTGIGLIPSQIKNLKSKIATIDDRVDSIQTRLDKERAALTKQFANLETLVSQMTTANNAMVTQLNALSIR